MRENQPHNKRATQCPKAPASPSTDSSLSGASAPSLPRQGASTASLSFKQVCLLHDRDEKYDQARRDIAYNCIGLGVQLHAVIDDIHQCLFLEHDEEVLINLLRAIRRSPGAADKVLPGLTYALHSDNEDVTYEALQVFVTCPMLARDAMGPLYDVYVEEGDGPNGRILENILYKADREIFRLLDQYESKWDEIHHSGQRVEIERISAQFLNNRCREHFLAMLALAILWCDQDGDKCHGLRKLLAVHDVLNTNALSTFFSRALHERNTSTAVSTQCHILTHMRERGTSYGIPAPALLHITGNAGDPWVRSTGIAAAAAVHADERLPGLLSSLKEMYREEDHEVTAHMTTTLEMIRTSPPCSKRGEQIESFFIESVQEAYVSDSSRLHMVEALGRARHDRAAAARVLKHVISKRAAFSAPVREAASEALALLNNESRCPPDATSPSGQHDP